MNVTDRPLQNRVYCCPDQKHAISRAVHLGRLAAFYSACRRCPHRDDTGTLSARQVEQLAATQQRAQPQSRFNDEGAAGVHLSELTPAAARDMAVAFGSALLQEGRETREHASLSPNTSSSNPQSLIPNPSILLASDGRPITAELTAAVGEGLRFSGCGVVDVGPATAACLAFAIHHSQAGLSGGVLVGNPGRQPHIVGLQFWVAGPRPLSAGGSLEPIIQRYQAGVNREARNYGLLGRAQVGAPYLAVLAEHYHALRPLRIVVDSASRPLVEYLHKLAAAVACQVIPSRVAPRELPEQVRGDAAHFAACVDGDGETCHVLDEQGRTVPTERLLLLLARQSLLSPPPANPAFADKTPAIVLEASTSQATVCRIEELGGRPVVSGGRRADTAAAIRENNALFAGGPSGRFWHRVAGVPLPDALTTITRLFVLLSRSDEPFSTVLDRETSPS